MECFITRGGGEEARDKGATVAASVSGGGDEHISKVKPGPLPTLTDDGLQECAFVGMCFVIEGLVGALGMIFGAAKDEHGAAAVEHDVTAPSALVSSEMLQTARNMLLLS